MQSLEGLGLCAGSQFQLPIPHEASFPGFAGTEIQALRLDTVLTHTLTLWLPGPYLFRGGEVKDTQCPATSVSLKTCLVYLSSK